MSFPAARFTRLELGVHAAADLLALWTLGKWFFFWLAGGGDPVSAWLAGGVLVLSLAVLAARLWPEVRGLRWLALGLSGLAAVAGALGYVACIAVLVSSLFYRGDSPDAGGMGALFGFLGAYMAAGLLLLPLGMNASLFPPRLKRPAAWTALALAVIPPVLLFVVGPFVTR